MRFLYKTIFYLPIIPITYQIYSIVYGLIWGGTGGLMGVGPRLYGFEAMMNVWVWIGFIGIVYVPFLIYQIVYLKFTKQKLFKKLFIIQLILILILEAPLLINLILRGF